MKCALLLLHSPAQVAPMSVSMFNASTHSVEEGLLYQHSLEVRSVMVLRIMNHDPRIVEILRWKLPHESRRHVAVFCCLFSKDKVPYMTQ